MKFHSFLIFFFAANFIAGLAADSLAGETEVTEAVADEQGTLVHKIRSPYQTGQTEVRIVPPTRLVAGRRYPVIYLLPVEAGRESRYGDSITEVLTHDLHNKHDVIFVAPTFSALPWYANHPSDRSLRQESHLLEAVIPAVESRYPVSDTRDDRLLLGFSKSGWGAWSLMLRNPDMFGKAAAWDAPLMMQQVGNYGNEPIFGTQQNFEQYRLTDLLRKNRPLFAENNRLILTGYGNFRDEHQRMHSQLNEWNIRHVYRDGPERTHDWHSGWVGEAVDLLLRRAATPAGPSIND